jgi:ankyrin repeat protein
VETVKLLLKAEPAHLHALSSVNGHTVLLQAAFYGKAKHLDLVSHLLDNAASISQRPAAELPEEQAKLLSATNVRGYSALTMQDLWHNQRMKDVLLRYYPDDLGSDSGRHLEERRLQYFSRLKLAIASPQALTESLLTAITEHLANGDTGVIQQRIDTILEHPAFDINRLGGDLQMPPLVFAMTGVDVGDPARAERRRELARQMLAAGADPAVREKHPMGVGAVIRASVLNNFGLLKLLAEHMTPEALAREMNVSPAVNGLTAMHDAIHRALTSPPAELDGHLAQIAWMIEHGASLDIPDHTGQTQYQLAESAQNDSAFPSENVEQCWLLVRGAAHRNDASAKPSLMS